MNMNTEKAVIIIAVLSLLLGFSLGQNHLQYRALQKIKTAAATPLPPPGLRHHSFNCDRDGDGMKEKLEALRAQLEERRAALEAQRRRAEEARVHALEQVERDRLRFEVKDPETGGHTIIRVVREE